MRPRSTCPAARRPSSRSLNERRSTRRREARRRSRSASRAAASGRRSRCRCRRERSSAVPRRARLARPSPCASSPSPPDHRGKRRSLDRSTTPRRGSRLRRDRRTAARRRGPCHPSIERAEVARPRARRRTICILLSQSRVLAQPLLGLAEIQELDLRAVDSSPRSRSARRLART